MRYEFRVAGRVSEALAESLPELQRLTVPEETKLFGHVDDEAQLYGLLTRFQSLGLRIVEMRRLPD